MKPEARCHGILVVSGFVEAYGKEVVGELASLGKSIDAFANFEIDPSNARLFGKVILLENFIGDIGKANARIFGAVERGVQVEVSNVETGKECMTARDDAVENDFCKFKWSCERADVARVENVITSDGNLRAIGVILVGFEFSRDFFVGDFLVPIWGGVLISDYEEGVGALTRLPVSEG